MPPEVEVLPLALLPCHWLVPLSIGSRQEDYIASNPCWPVPKLKEKAPIKVITVKILQMHFTSNAIMLWYWRTKPACQSRKHGKHGCPNIVYSPAAHMSTVTSSLIFAQYITIYIYIPIVYVTTINHSSLYQDHQQRNDQLHRIYKCVSTCTCWRSVRMTCKQKVLASSSTMRTSWAWHLCLFVCLPRQLIMDTPS